MDPAWVNGVSTAGVRPTPAGSVVGVRFFSFDVETHLGQPRSDKDPGGQPGIGAPPLVCATVAELAFPFVLPDGRVNVAPGSERALAKADARAWFRWVLEQPEIHLVNIAMSFDLAVMAADDPSVLDLIFAALDAGRIHDIGLREGLLDIARGAFSQEHHDEDGARYSLAQLVERYLRIDISASKKDPDGWRFRFARLDGVPISEYPPAALAYLYHDATYPLQVFVHQENAVVEIDGQPVPRANLHDEPNQVAAAFALRLISVWGLRTNRDRVAALRTSAEAAEREIIRELSAPEIGIYRPDGSVNKKRLAELVAEAYHGNPPYTSPSDKYPAGQVATDRDTLLESGHPLLVRKANAGKNDKRLSTYLPILEQGLDRPWLPYFNPLVATGRVSSDAQQFPTGQRSEGGVRECFESRPGYVFGVCDVGGMELCSMSQRAINVLGYSKMAEALNAERDLHAQVGGEFIGVAYLDMLARVEAKDPAASALRQLAKIFNFGKGGGMGAFAMAYNARSKDGVRFCLSLKQLERCGSEGFVEGVVRAQKKRVCAVCVSIAKDLGRKWLDAWPEQDELFDMAGRLQRQWKEYGGPSVLIYGSNIRRGRVTYSQWLNSPFQGMGGHAVKRATYLIQREAHTDRRSPLWGSHLVLNVHDELVGEHPRDRAPEAVARVAQVMTECVRAVTPDVRVKVEPVLTEVLSKGAKSIRDAAGRIVVWKPKAA